MENAKIFLVEGKQNLTSIDEQINPGSPRRWFLLTKELGIPASEGETSQRILDHFFLDQDGIPTFVECKRASDKRSHLEIVAQLLDYAANGMSYWKIEDLRQSATDIAQKNGKSLDTEILKLIGLDDISIINPYWKLVEENLERGNVRLIFVADVFPAGLRHLVEYLNNRLPMDEALDVESTPTSPTLTDNPGLNGRIYNKLFASLAGIILGLIIFGGVLAYIVINGSFARHTMPLAAALWTPTHSPTTTRTQTVKIVRTPTSTVTVTPSPTPTLTFSQRMELADPFITKGFDDYYAGNYAESILSWDKAIEIVPEDAVSHRMRGDAYYKLLNNQRSQEEHNSYLEHALNDYDIAISLEPMNGDFYLARAKVYDILAGQQETRVGFQAYEKIALDNLQTSYFFGNSDDLSNRYILTVLEMLGECDNALAETQKQFDEQTEPSATLNTAMAKAYFCKGSLNQAFIYIDKAISITDSQDRIFQRALILYTMGRYTDAEEEINRSINESPDYAGYRYYLRGLIYIAQGYLTKAQQDLDFGAGNTWGRGGLLSYAQGKLALARGDEESAIGYFQEAEATYHFQDPILEMIRTDLANLDAQPREVSPQVVDVTPIPSLTPSLTPRPTSTLQFTPTPDKYNVTPDDLLNHATVIDLSNGTGPIKLDRGGGLLFRFQPAQPIEYRVAQSLSVILLTDDNSQENPLQISLYNFRDGMWLGPDDGLKWGENEMDAAWEYISPDGDVFMRVDNASIDQVVQIANLGVKFAVQNIDGNIELYGLSY